MKKILVASKDRSYSDVLLARLREFAKTEAVFSSNATLIAAKQWCPDVILIDISSGKDFIDLIRLLRNDILTRDIGIIALVENIDPVIEDLVFQNGADNLLGKPFQVRSLQHRIDALIARIEGFKKHYFESLEIGPIRIEPLSKRVFCNGKNIPVTPTQFEILFALSRNSEELVSRTWMKKNIWHGNKISLRSIDAHISKLKSAIPELNLYLINVYGEGYLMTKKLKVA